MKHFAHLVTLDMDFWTKSAVLRLGFEQLLSLLLTFAGLSSSQLAIKGIDAPATQCFLIYVLLALVYGGIMLYRRQPLKVQLYYHVVLALLEVLVKFFAIKAFQYTSLTSVMLLDCWTISCAMLLAWLFFKAKYGVQIFCLQNMVGVAICIAGFVIVVLSDVHSTDRSSGINPLKGDLLIIVGTTIFGVNRLYKELFLGKADAVELMALMGIFGAILTALKIAISEHNEIKFIISSSEALFFVIGFSLAMFLLYSGVNFLLEISGSKTLKFSFFTTNMWVVLIRIFAYHEKVDWIYFVALYLVILGTIIYLREDEKEMDPNNGEAPIDEEAGLGHSNNVGSKNKEGSRISFQETQNSFCYLSCITKIQAENVRE